MSKIDQNSATWDTIVRHAHERLQFHREKLESRNTPLDDVAHHRSAIAELKQLLDLTKETSP